MFGKNLEVASTEKDFGVIISNDLKVEEHFSTIVRKANQMKGMIKISFE